MACLLRILSRSRAHWVGVVSLSKNHDLCFPPNLMTIQEETALHENPSTNDAIRALKDVAFGSVRNFHLPQNQSISICLIGQFVFSGPIGN
jgi:hypothetical protein